MKIKLDQKYVKISAYTILTALIVFVLYSLIANFGSVLKTILLVLGIVLSVLSPLLIALLITYLLHPLVSRIDTAIATNFRYLSSKSAAGDKHQHLRRTSSVLITYLLFLTMIVLFIYSLYVLISGSLPKPINLSSMIASIVDYSSTYDELFGRLINTLQTSGLPDNYRNYLLSFAEATQDFIGRGIAGLFASLQQIGHNLFRITLGFVIAFYLLKDIEYFRNLYHTSITFLINPRHNKQLNHFMADINHVVSNFIRGQLLVALIVGVLSSMALYIIGLDFAVLVGMTAGIFNIIPYFGPLVGIILALTVALISGSPLKALLAVVALLVIQQLDGNIISPKIVGDSVGLHPVFIILSIIIGGSFLGILGMLLAVPTAGIIKLLLNHWYVYTQQKTAASKEETAL